MKYLAIAVAITTAVVVGIGPSAVGLAQPKPEFKLGFKTLADLAPWAVGQPVEPEHHGPNGDSLQQTTKGLMVWRKADNWTAFTNGERTWINGPDGLRERGNEERFAWEGGTKSATEGIVIPPPSTVQAPPPGTSRYDLPRIGQRVEADGVRLKVSKTEKTETIGRIWKAGARKTFLIVDVVLTTRGWERFPYNRYHFSVRESIGPDYGPSIATGSLYEPLDSGTIRPDDIVMGEIAFEIPWVTSSLVLTFDPPVRDWRGPIQILLDD